MQVSLLLLLLFMLERGQSNVEETNESKEKHNCFVRTPARYDDLVARFALIVASSRHIGGSERVAVASRITLKGEAKGKYGARQEKE